MPPAGIGVGWLIAAVAASTAIGVGTSLYTSSQEAKEQKKLQEAAFQRQDTLTAAQEAKAAAAEQAAKNAEILAAEEAATTLKKKRMAQTQTILTSPLGVTEAANTKGKSLLGG